MTDEVTKVLEKRDRKVYLATLKLVGIEEWQAEQGVDVGKAIKPISDVIACLREPRPNRAVREGYIRVLTHALRSLGAEVPT